MTKIFPKLNLLQLVQPRHLHQLLNEAIATHPLKLHLGTYKQLHCFLLSIAKLTSIPQQVIELTKKLRKKKKNRKKRNTRNKIK